MPLVTKLSQRSKSHTKQGPTELFYDDFGDTETILEIYTFASPEDAATGRPRQTLQFTKESGRALKQIIEKTFRLGGK
jgi:hypothetical protein